MSERLLRAVWVHDHFFETQDDGITWSESQFDSSLWKRYLDHFDVLTVVARRRVTPRTNFKKWTVKASAPRVQFELLPSLSGVKNLWKNYRVVSGSLREAIKASDVVIVRLPSELGYVALAHAKALGKPTAVEVVGCAWDALFNYGSIVGKIYAPFALLRMRRSVRAADAAIYVTEKFLQRRYPTLASLVTNASNVSLGNLDEGTLQHRLERIGQDAQKHITLGIIGSLGHKYKGLHLLLNAVSKLRRRYPGIRLRVLGAGKTEPWEQMAEKLGIADIVNFDGVIPGGAPVLEWLDTIDIYVQPSLQEGLPRALIEAMSRGLPCIASDVAGIPELLPNNDIVKRNSTKSLHKALLEKLSDKQWKVLAAKANFRTAQNYQSHVLVPRRYNFFQALATTARETQRHLH